MNDAASTLAALRQYVELAMVRRRRGLLGDDRARMEDLEELLRDAIEGARLAPKRIANPSPAASSGSSRGPRRPAPGPTPAPSAASAAANKSVSLGAVAEALPLTPADAKKLGSVSLAELPRSGYTPPAVPAFMSDYYSDSLVPAPASDAVPRGVVSADGEPIQLTREVKVLLGLERPQSPAPAARAHAQAAPATSAASVEAAGGTPVMVHLMAGGTVRGQVDAFDPQAQEVVLLPRSPGAPPQRVGMTDVLAVFFGLRRGEEPTSGTGPAVAVRLVNDRQVSGVTPDYQEGATALTILPEPRRGNVDRIWIPARAVKAIELLES